MASRLILFGRSQRKMNTNEQFTKTIAKLLVPYLYHHDPKMDGQVTDN